VEGALTDDVDADTVTIQLVALTDGLAMQSILDPVAMRAIGAKDAVARIVDTALQRATVPT
jgi:hypothetical protein